MLEPFTHPYVREGLFEIVVLSIAAGLLGTWIVLRGLAFYAHAAGAVAFPGLVLADGLGFAATLGAFGAATIFAIAVGGLGLRRRAGYDSLTALVLVACLAGGVILASDVFHSGSGIETLLFGSALLIDRSDIVLAAVASGAVVLVSRALAGRWLAEGFDPDGAEALGLRSPLPDLALLLLLALSVTAALSAVGSLLVTALFVVPAATTRLWVNRLASWQLWSIALAAVEGVGGLWLSVKTNAPPGATIAVLAGGIFALAALARAAAEFRLVRTAGAMAAFAGVALLAGCGGGGGGSSQLDVVATTTQLGDFARQIGGPKVTVHQILVPNTDPHDYEPRPKDVEATADADLILLNGDNLDTWMKKVISDSGSKGKAVDLGAQVPEKVPGETSGPEASRYDPHWWHDPRNAKAAVQGIAMAIGDADPALRSQAAANAKSYETKLDALDQGIQSCFQRVPASKRKLVTDHDAFNYFAKRYGIQVVGAVIPSQTTQAQASAGDLARLSKLIKAEGVTAVFPESSLNPKVAEAIARETGATSNYVLYGDTLGPKGSTGATYLQMETANANAMVRGFTGGKGGCVIPSRG
jgi:ABC-type Zn uptake system ZnuABC Zn-binding protein ZnuA/ABC-type Mn2+/Zn2+ transport system permease subunit